MSEQVFDVLIVGSGHTGGMAAKILTEQGIRCLMLSAGPVADVARDAVRKPAYELPYRGFRPPDRVPHVFQSSEFNANVWVDEKEVPYTCDPGKEYNLGARAAFGRAQPLLGAPELSLLRLRVQGKNSRRF
jgi:choline dehydrogenase-like flavoprotein